MSTERATTIQETLSEVFGFASFREGQEAVITQVLAGKSALAVFPTGSGKSLCYQLPALHLEGLTLVVSPLIALMKDQIDFLVRRGIAAARLDSSVGLEAVRATNAALADGTLKLLYVAPERFSNERFISKLRGVKIAMLVIDEAHCISEWGHNFRPDYLKLARLATQLKVGRVLGLTATATPAVAADICRAFAIAPEAYVHTGFHRPNLTLHVTTCPGRDKLALLLSRLRERPRGPTIVYVTLQRTAEWVAQQLAGAGLPARAYHAGMEAPDREATQNWFMESADPLVVATIAFGMGIDKADIRYVYHYNLAKSLENYSQEIGRAGRDGQPSICEMLADAEDATVLENFTYGDTPEAESLSALIAHLLGQPREFDVSVHELSGSFDIRPLVVNTLLTYLELEGVLQTTAPFYNEYKFQPLRSSAEILARFDERRQEFLRGLLRQAVKAKTWFTIDTERAAGVLQVPRQKVVAALTYLEEQGDLTLQVAGVRQGYRMAAPPADGLAELLAERFRTREANDIARVRQVLAWAAVDTCQVRALLAHFGEDLPGPCGHCGICHGAAPAAFGRPPDAPVPDLSSPAIAAVRQEYATALGSPRRLARFLCGLSSPLLIKTKLGRHALFGTCDTIPFAQVLAAANALT